LVKTAKLARLNWAGVNDTGFSGTEPRAAQVQRDPASWRMNTPIGPKAVCADRSIHRRARGTGRLRPEVIRVGPKYRGTFRCTGSALVYADGAAASVAVGGPFVPSRTGGHLGNRSQRANWALPP
jgi:hypothetical protein